MKNLVGIMLRVFGLVVYFGLAFAFFFRWITGSGDPLVPLVAIILISGFSAILTVVMKLTEAVTALTETTNAEVELLISMSQTNSLAGKIKQREGLN